MLVVVYDRVLVACCPCNRRQQGGKCSPVFGHSEVISIAAKPAGQWIAVQEFDGRH